MASSQVPHYDTMVIIKDEPQDDDFLMPDAAALPTAPTLRVHQGLQTGRHLTVSDNGEPSASKGRQAHPPPPPSSNRAKAPDGGPHNSMCFEEPYLSRPQFHRLICGHDIATVAVERCGANCHPPSRPTGSDQKPDNMRFECPDPQCKRRANVLPSFDQKTRRRKYGRVCVLAHVRGRDSEADKAWDEEKGRQNHHSARTRAARSFGRKTSRSPSPKRGQISGPRGDRPETRSNLMRPNATEQDLGRVRPAVVLSELEIARMGPTQMKKKLSMACYERRVKQSRPVPGPAFTEPEGPSKDWDAVPVGDQDNAEVEAAEEDHAEEEDELHCVCRSSDCQWMVECNRCDEPFHPGCIGKGAHDAAQYELPSRDLLFEFDAKNSTSEFLCLFCEAHGKVEAGIRDQRRKMAEHFKRSELLLQFHSKLMARKQTALDRAQGQEQEDTVTAFFASIEQEMNECGSLQLRDWRALLTKALEVPLAPPRIRKRGAAEVEPEEAGSALAVPSRDNAEPPRKRQAYMEGEEVTLPIIPPKQAPIVRM